MTDDGDHRLDGWVGALEHVHAKLQPPGTRGSRCLWVKAGDRELWVLDKDLKRLRKLLDHAPPGYALVAMLEDDDTIRFRIAREKK